MISPPDPRADPRRRCLPLAEWPAGDRRAWEAALKKGDLLDPGGPASAWAPSTLHAFIRCYGRWLNWLALNGLLDEGLGPADRLRPEWVRAYVAELRGLNAPVTVFQKICHLRQLMGVLAPGLDLRWLREAEARLRSVAIPSRNKRARLVPSRELVALGIYLMDKAAASAAPAKIAAIGFRDGLVIALLAARPFRIKNFTSIEIGRHLANSRDGYWLRFEAPEMKNRRPLEVPFPRALTPYLEQYLDLHRPVLLGARSGRNSDPHPTAALWIGEGGSPLTIDGISRCIARVTQRALGRKLNPHIFRDCAATSIAEEDPEHVRIVQSILGHTNHVTGERCYTHARSIRAVHRLQDEILRLRKGARPRPPALRPPPPRPGTSAKREGSPRKPIENFERRSHAGGPTGPSGRPRARPKLD